MNITRNLIKFSKKYPVISSAGYAFLQKYWKVKSNFTEYAFPKDTEKASVDLKQVVEYNKHRPYGPKKRICYAPFNNLHFQMNGDVSSCSFNYDFILGNVNTNSIKEIWFGEKAENFRNTLADYSFHKCQSCQNVLDAENFSSFPPLKYDVYSNDSTIYPTQMSFEMSDLCNYECIMCNESFSSLIRKNRAKLPPLKFKYPDSFFEELKEFIPNLKIATFIGGEPLLIKPYFNIWEMILKENNKCLIHIQTNASFLPPRFLEMLETGQFDIGVSIDGITKETFESIRINSNFEEVLQNIQILKEFDERGKINMNINFCPLTMNWKEIPKIVEYASQLNVPLKIVNVENPRHLSLHHRSEVYLKKIIHYYKEYQIPIGEQSSIITKRNFNSFNDYIKQLEFLIKESVKREEVFQLLLSENPDSLNDLFIRLYLENKLFANYRIDEKNKIGNDLLNYIQNKTVNKDIQNRVLLRVYHMLMYFDHTAESESSTNIDESMKILKNAADEFFLLEKESL